MDYTNIGGRLATAIGATENPMFQFTDHDDVTYTPGTPSHLAISAIARPDVTPELSFDERFASHLRDVARLVGIWFTCEEADVNHASAFAALSPREACEVVVRAAMQRSIESLEMVGAQTLSVYTNYLLNGTEEDVFPEVVDQRISSLSEDRLDLMATAAEGVTEVPLSLHVAAREVLTWGCQRVIEVDIPVELVNTVRMYGPDESELVRALVMRDLDRDEAECERLDMDIVEATTSEETATTATQRLLELADCSGIDDLDLSELVMEILTRQWCGVNSGGLASQLTFLVNAIGEREVAQHLRQLAGN